MRSAGEKNNRKFTTPQNTVFCSGGIGTHEEDTFLHEHYQFDRTGWGTPFC